MTRVDRPYARRAGLVKKVRSESGAGALARRAGLVERPSVDPLEKRQLLFSLVVTADQVDPNTGIGTATQFFGYVLPRMGLIAQLPDVQAPQQRAEDFNDEPIGAVGSGQFMIESNILVRHNVVPGRDIRIGSDEPPPTPTERYMFLDLHRQGEFASFQLFNEGDNPTTPLAASSVTFLITGDNIPPSTADLTGLFSDNMVVELILNNRVTATFTGAALRAATTGNGAQGTGQFTFNGPNGDPVFDTVRIRTITDIAGGLPGFRLDNLSFTVPQTRFANQFTIFGAEAILSGPVGARADFTDILGRDMIATIALGAPNGSDRLLVDGNDDGIANFNEGIGAIRFSNTDSRTSFTIWGGDITQADTRPQDSDFFDFRGFSYKRHDSVSGSYDPFEQAGWGFYVDNRQQQNIFGGLPPTVGDVIIGSPFVRSLANYNPTGFAPDLNVQGAGVWPVTTGFTRADQGLFVENGAAMGSAYIHGMLFGSSVFTGAVDRITIGALMGSITVKGDLGTLTVGTDAGVWSPENQSGGLNEAYDTGGQLVVERSLGRVDIGARSAMDITVIGDLNSPTTRPARDSYTFYESEFMYGLQPPATEADIVRAIINNSNYITRQPSTRFRQNDQALAFNGGTIRNDTIMGAEFINSTSSGVRIVGDLSGRDPVNGEDSADVYAFATDGVNEVVFDVTGNVALARVVDENGRTLAAPQLGIGSERVAFNGQFRFKPQAPGIYYLVLTDGQLGDNGFGSAPYSVAVSGLASVTLGSVRTAASLGVANLNPSITVLTGDMGVLRVGTGVVNGGGADDSPLGGFNNPTGANVDDSLNLIGATVSVPGNLYGIVCGSDIGLRSAQGLVGAVRFTIGGNLGTLITGQSPVVGRGPGEGDANFLSILVGGSIGSIQISGGIGMDQDARENNGDPRAPVAGVDSVVIRTGQAGGRGDIGLFRTGFSVVGDSLNVTVSPGSSVGAFLIAQDPGEYQASLDLLRGGGGDARFGVYGGVRGVPFSSGSGSSVGFVDIPRIDLSNSSNARTDLFGGTPVQFVDDSGARVNISIDGFGVGALGEVVSLPIDGSQGVAVGLIDVDLSNGRTLTIQGIGSGGKFQVGRIRVSNADAASRIVITGGVQVDVYRIDMDGNSPLLEIINDTVGGDIVAIDVGSLGRLEVHGNLGTTEVPAWGPRLIGPELGLAADLQQQIGGALGFAAGDGFIDPDFGGDIYRPIQDDTAQPGQAYLDDIGGPMDSTLNGLVVRNGDLQEVVVYGSMGDVILQGDGATLVSLRANADGQTAFGAFDGIVGNIYAANMTSIDIGDGLAKSEPSPLLTSGIVAANDINQVFSSRGSGASINGVIIAVNNDDAAVIGDQVQGLTSVNLSNGLYDGAFIASMAIDSFWNGLLYSDPDLTTGDIRAITGSNTNFYRSRAQGFNLTTFNLSQGYFDASSLNVVGRAESIHATGFRNSTLLGGPLELTDNIVSTAGDLVSLVADEDMNDLVVDVTGSVIGSITARDITRSTLNVDNFIQGVSVSRSLKSSEIVAGELRSFNANTAIESSSFAISGPINNLTAGTRIANTKVEVTGPDGRIDNISARDLVSGDISASGPIGTIQASQGDLIANIVTTTSLGNVSTLRAGRDVVAYTDISGNLQNLIAGRNIGSQTQKGVVLVRGTLSSASAPNGQLFSDIRSGGAINSVTAGRAISKPGNNQLGTGSIISFGRLGSVNITGDFGGDIISYSGGIGSISITNGSLMPGRTVAAYAGDLNSLTITNGNLFANVYSDFDIRSLRVTNTADGVFGNVGVIDGRSQFTSYDAYRNQLPVGVQATTAKEGPRIAAGKNIVSISISGSVSEAVFQAGRAIQNISIAGSVHNDALTSGYGSAFVAGDSIDAITITGNADLTQFLAGVVNLGADNRPGGLGSNADAVKSGNITRVTVSGNTTNSQFLAGMSAGIDGQYGTGDDRVALGSSNIATLSLGNASNVLAQGDSLSASVAGDARLIRITDLTSVDPILDNGVGTPGAAVTSGQAITFQSGTITVALSGPGQAFFDATNGRLTLRNTTSASTLVVTSSLATLNNLSIVTNDDASLGSLRITPALAGTSQVVVDGNIGTLDLGAFSGAGRITVGGDISTANLSTFTNGTLSARNIASLNATGDFGATTPGSAGRPAIRTLSGGSMTFRAAMRGIVSVDRDLSSISVIGAVDRGAIRVGASLNSFNASAGTSQLVLSVGQSLGSVNITGNAFDSAFLAGIDLGTDAAFGGTGTAADRASAASIGSVSVSGSFQQSDIIASYLRGADGFYGTSDDTVAPGLSTIGSVNIAGAQVGSTRFSEAYRIASSGDIGTVRVGGTTMTTPRGNFALEAGRGQIVPVNIRPIDIKVTADSGQYVASLVFNQPIDFSTVAAGLSVSEVRGTADVTIRLIEGIDYTISYNASTNAVLVRFSRDVTNRPLPQVPGQPGPGVYRFELSQAIVHGKSLAAKIDGNNDGFSTPGDSFVGHAVVGDAGDKFFSEVVTAGAGATATSINFYGPDNLDFILDDRAHPDGLPDPNQNFVLRGVIGDHPNNDATNFVFAGDTDVYSVTLQAGQILRLSAIRGAASGAPVTLYDPNGNAITDVNANGQGFGGLDVQAAAVLLPATQTFVAQQLISDSAYLIKQTGSYRIVVGQNGTVNTPGGIAPVDTPVGAGTLGAYEFDVYIFDDGDSGFASSTDSGNGTGIVNAPDPIVFAGADLAFNTADDRSSVTINGYTFTIAPGTDNVLGTSDDVVSGINALGYTSTRTGGTMTSTIASAIGPANHSGVPGEVFSDADVYQLNNGSAIAAGTKMRVTIKLADTGSNLGSSLFVGRFDASLRLPTDQRGNVQFGLFETTGLTNVTDANIADAKLIFSPSDFLPFATSGAKAIADNGASKYGYDANGDFYIDFVTPDSVVSPGFAGSFALYLQGVFNVDYKIEVVTTTGTTAPSTTSQNFLIETNGGSINWLEAGGIITELQRFSADSIGFKGFVNANQTADEYILANLLDQLNTLFGGAGYDVHFSSNPADFEFQPFSTIYLSNTNDPLNTLFESFDLATTVPLPGQALPRTAFISTQPFGFSEHSDPFNTDLEDEAVVLAPSFSLLGLTPSRTDVDVFTDALTGAVARRAGELMGLRLNTDDTGGNTAFDFQAANASNVTSGTQRTYAFPNADRQLSSGYDSISNTNFFLGRQNSASLLDKILSRV